MSSHILAKLHQTHDVSLHACEYKLTAQSLAVTSCLHRPNRTGNPAIFPAMAEPQRDAKLLLLVFWDHLGLPDVACSFSKSLSQRRWTHLSKLQWRFEDCNQGWTLGSCLHVHHIDPSLTVSNFWKFHADRKVARDLVHVNLHPSSIYLHHLLEDMGEIMGESCMDIYHINHISLYIHILK